MGVMQELIDRVGEGSLLAEPQPEEHNLVEDLRLAVVTFPPDGTLGRLKSLHAVLVGLESAQGELFQGIPLRWATGDTPRWRCMNGCVYSTYKKGPGNIPVCFGCGKAVMLTFPEDG